VVHRILRKKTAASTSAIPAIPEKSFTPTRFSQSNGTGGAGGGVIGGSGGLGARGGGGSGGTAMTAKAPAA